jgi:predicted ATPase
MRNKKIFLKLDHRMLLMTNPATIEIMKLMDKTAICAYLTKCDIAFVLATISGVRYTQQHGFVEESPAFACMIGIIIMHVFGDWEAGSHYAEMAMSILDMLDKQYMASAVIMHAHSFILCWTNPWRNRIRYFMDGYEVACMPETQSMPHTT